MGEESGLDMEDSVGRVRAKSDKVDASAVCVPLDRTQLHGCSHLQGRVELQPISMPRRKRNLVSENAGVRRHTR